MRRFILLFIAITAFARPLLAGGRTLSRAEIEPIVAKVIESFTHGSSRPVASILKIADDNESANFTEAIGAYRAVDIADWHVDSVWTPPETTTARVTIQGSVTRWDGSKGPFPPRWTIRIENDGGHPVIAAVSTDEAAIAWQMLPPQSDADRLCLLQSRPDLQPAKILKLLADDLTAAGRGKLSEDAYVFAFQWAREHHDIDLEIACTTLASTRALMYDDLQMAVAFGDAAVDIAPRGTDLDMVAAAEFSSGIAKWRAGSTDAALRDIRASADRVHTMQRPTIALVSEYMYAYIRGTRGEFRESIESARRLLDESQTIHWPRGELLANWLIGDSESALHNDDLARDYHRRVVEANRRAGKEDDANIALADVARDEAQLGHLIAARDLLKEAIERMGRAYFGITASATLSHVLVQLGEYDEAEKVLDRSESFVTPDESLRGQTALARSELAFARKRYADAEKFARKAILAEAANGKLETFRTVWPAQTALARALYALGRRDEAELAYRDAINTVEGEIGAAPSDDVTRFRFYEDRVAPYRGLAELLAAGGRSAEALAITEAIRARALRDIVEQGKVDLDADLTPDERKEKQTLEQRLMEATRASIGAGAGTAARRDLDHARLALEELDTLLAVRHERTLGATVARRGDIVAGDYLRPGEAAVEYLVGDRQTLAFVVNRQDGQTRVRVRMLPVGSHRLRTMVNRLAGAVRQRDLRWAAASRAVYDAVFGPLAPDLARFRHICVIPDGDLWSVPFDVLRDERGVALIEKATISYSPSLLMLRDMRRGHPAVGSRTLLAMANPAINSGTTALVRSIERDASLGALPDAEREVERLRDLYGAAHSDVHVGADARESLFKSEAGRYRILHIATHGMVDDRSPMYSCLVLAPDADDDGLLEMREIVGLDLHADLAVLSSCDTARGQISRGEGVVGIAWAFLAAGCPTTVVSQWKVDSAATERLMVDFHRDLIRDDFRGKADALRQAKLTLMKDPRYQHPFYWAPFIVVGNP